MKKLSVAIAFALALGGCGEQAMEKGKEAAAQSLRDPSSAQFRNVTTNGNYVCGEINGKNAFGGFAGFSEFYAFEAAGGEWMAQIYNEDELRQLEEGGYEELARQTRANFKDAQAECTGDEKLIESRKMERFEEGCAQGIKEACDYLELSKGE